MDNTEIRKFNRPKISVSRTSPTFSAMSAAQVLIRSMRGIVPRKLFHYAWDVQQDIYVKLNIVHIKFVYIGFVLR